MTPHEMICDGRGKYIKEFFRFLKDNNIYSAYFRTLKNDLHPDNAFNYAYKHNVNYFLEHCHPVEWLTECFTWSLQIEGRSFWENFHHMWIAQFRLIVKK